MTTEIRLLSTDFDGTLVSRVSEPVLDRQCIELIRQMQDAGAIWTINTGRSVDLLESGLTDYSFPIRPDFILTNERDVFRPGQNGDKWEAFGDWNERCAREHAEIFSSSQSVLAEVVDFVTQKTKARLIYHSEGVEGLVATDDEEMDRITRFIEKAREQTAEIPLPAKHRLPAFLPRRLSQRGRSGRACPLDQDSARKYFRRRRSSQRHLDVGWQSRGNAFLSRECDRRSERCCPCGRRICRPARARRWRSRGAAIFS